MIVDRIEADARAAHIAVGGRGCRANVTAIFVRDGKAVLAALNRTDPGLFRDVGAGERRRLLAEDGPVHVLHATEIRSRDGDRLKAGTSATSAGKPDVPYLEVRSASILGLPTRQDINGAVILIDTPATVGKTLQQLADYIAMRVLARTREVGSGRGGDTILTLFDDAAPPPGMTSFDTGYLAALYKGDGTRTGAIRGRRDRAQHRSRPQMTDHPIRSFDWLVPEGQLMGHIPVPFDQRAVFGKARPPVIVTLAGYSYRSTIAIMAGETFIPLRRSHREAAGVASGDTIAVTLTLDTGPRVVESPDDLAAAIDAAGLRAAWDALSFTRRREHVDAVVSAKKADTRARRIAATLAMLAPRD